MQPWSRQSQCIFCLFRSDLRQSSPFSQPAQSRKYASSTIRDHDRRSIRVKDAIASPSSPSSSASRRSQQQSSSRQEFSRNQIRHLLRDKRFQVKDEKRLRFSRNKTDEGKMTDEEKRRAAVQRALRKTYAYLSYSKMSKNSETSQKDGLDPSGDLWPKFASAVMALVDDRSTSVKHLRLVDGLSTALSEKSSDVLQREIHFAFLNFVLDHGDRWKEIAQARIDLRYPPEWYHLARRQQRVIHLHVGPTNSGKTYTALKRLEQSGDGFYAGPLRLLAHEVYSRFRARGIRCDLVTGDDIRVDTANPATVYASTVEMVDAGRLSQVGVIDEIQMLGDSSRGWAWTRALLAAQVPELHLCGETRVVPLIRELVASMGDTLHIHQYERLNPLKVMSKSLRGDLKNLRKGDCVVSFSIVGIHALKRQIELETGKHCAVVYGSLPPETRAAQAALFNDPDNDYDFLVASDAIGMGLNLSIKRIIFETTQKYNGERRERMTVPQIKQIAGRAGRYRTARDDKAGDSTRNSSSDKPKERSIGLVSCLDEVDLPVLQHALSTEGTPLKTAGILPPGEAYEDLFMFLPEGTPFEFILRRASNDMRSLNRYSVCEIKDAIKIAQWLDPIQSLSVEDRLLFCAAPATYAVAPSSNAHPSKVVISLARTVAEQQVVTVADVPEIPLEVLDAPMTADREYLAALEALHKSLIVYLWLSYRFERHLTDRDMAVRAKELCEERINTTLLKFSANPKLAKRLKNIRKSSELLAQQARESGQSLDSVLITNPDQTVQQMDDAAAASTEMDTHGEIEHDSGLEEKVEMEGELDLGEDPEAERLSQSNSIPHAQHSIQDEQLTDVEVVSEQRQRHDDESDPAIRSLDDEQPRRAEGSG